MEKTYCYERVGSMCEYGDSWDIGINSQTVDFPERDYERINHLNDNVGDPCGCDFPATSDNNDSENIKKQIADADRVVQLQKANNMEQHKGGAKQ